MGDISYAPTFHHVDWEDRRDRVQAAGPNGFNARFHDIHSDLLQLSTVVGQIDTALDQLGGPLTGERRYSLPLAFQPVPDNAAWAATAIGTAKGPLSETTTLWGVMNIAPPDGVLLSSLRVAGVAGPGTNLFSLDVQLVRSPVVPTIPPGGGSEAIASLTIEIGPQFTMESPVASSRRLVDLNAFRYFVMAIGFLGLGSPGSTITIESIQLAYSVG